MKKTDQIGSGDKVVCIDATPFPNFSPRDSEVDEYLFPDGFIEEGSIYCVEESFIQNGLLGLFLVGRTIIFRGEEVGWYSGRFRKVESPRQSDKAIKELEMADQKDA